MHLDPTSAVFEAMLEGWATQQRARFLKANTIGPRLELVRRLAAFTNQYPWQWEPAEAEALITRSPALDLHCLRHSYITHLPRRHQDSGARRQRPDDPAHTGTGEGRRQGAAPKEQAAPRPRHESRLLSLPNNYVVPAFWQM